jgi:hypothetical protein
MGNRSDKLEGHHLKGIVQEARKVFRNLEDLVNMVPVNNEQTCGLYLCSSFNCSHNDFC